MSAAFSPSRSASWAANRLSGFTNSFRHTQAPINQVGAISEGVQRPFGGSDPADDSGDIQYLVILCGGVEIAPDNEINGLTFAATGSGTRVSHVQAHLIADDGFEWFGGTTNADHLISSGNDDDAFDCDFGWTGTVQFGLAIQDRELANRGRECDNDGNGFADCDDFACEGWAACPLRDGGTRNETACDAPIADEDTVETCSDGCSNDGDRFVDCDDRSCAGVGSCGSDAG